MNDEKLLQLATQAAQQASKAILKVYERDFKVEFKSDQSPLTEADTQAHKIIEQTLRATELPLLSEESEAIPYSDRQQWQKYWLVDPLDGTKQFVEKLGQFTVNIALVENGRVILGVVTEPTAGNVYWAQKDKGAWRQNADGAVEQIHVSNRQKPIRVVASRSHLNEDTQKFIDELEQPVVLIQSGSSKKILLVAEGKADIYPRLNWTMEWDTAAAQIIVEEAGGTMLQADNQEPVVYNKESLRNPYFIVSN